MSSITYMHGRTETYDELRKPVTEKSAGQLIDAAIDLWIAGKGPAPALVSDPNYSGPRPLAGKGEAYTHWYRTYAKDVNPDIVHKGKHGYGGGIDRDKSVGYIFVDVPATEPADAFAGITRAEYDAYVSRVKVSRTGVVTAVKARKAAARKTVVKCCPHCGGTL